MLNKFKKQRCYNKHGGSIMTIHRNFEFNPVKDFRTNVEPKLRVNQITEEIYEDGKLVGWNIKFLY
jgi:hypothetical protein